jgi:monoamine oxidase
MTDVIVVGAGLSGLVCARRLREAGKSVVVLEARDRIGGRMHSIPFAGTTIDLGAQWMSVGQPRLAALAAELGVSSFPQEREGTPLFAIEDGRRITSAIARWRAARRVERLAKSPPAADTSLADWLARNIERRTAADLVAMHAELVFATDPSSVSLLHYLDVFARTGGFSPKGADLPGGGREHRFVGGAQAIAVALANDLDVRLSSPVRAIVDGNVHTDAGILTAERIVLALPPSLMREIDVALPALPPSVLGHVVKCFAAYEHAFWRDDGLSGEAFRPRGDIRATVALETILLAFVVGPPATAWHHRSVDDRRALVLATFVEQFGEAAATPLDYVEVDWSQDPWSTGCVASLPPHAFATPASWRAPFGRLHFAGTESADSWPGYMEGAIDAGERAARELL